MSLHRNVRSARSGKEDATEEARPARTGPCHGTENLNVPAAGGSSMIGPTYERSTDRSRELGRTTSSASA